MERRACKLYFRCVQTLEISFLWGCKLGNMFFVVGQSTRPIIRRRFQSWDSRTVIILSHSPYLTRIRWLDISKLWLLLSNLLEFVNLLDGCFGGRSWWKLIWFFSSMFMQCLPPLTSMQKASTCTLFLLHYNKSFALLLFQLYVIGVRSISMRGVYKWPTHWGS